MSGLLSQNLPWDLARTKWASVINPFLANPLSNGLFVKASLVSGLNVINHGLGRVLQGYLIVMNDASATFYDQQQKNSKPQLTLELIASAPANVTIYVF